MASSDAFRLLIETGDVEGVRSALKAEPALANQTIRWFLNQKNQSDPLHYVSDCVNHGWLHNGQEGKIADLLLEHGAIIEGTEGRGSPLIASASLGAEKVTEVLIGAGAQLERTCTLGARAVHWAAWMGSASSVELLLARNVAFEARCTAFGATPLFWAVHGYGPNGPAPKREQVRAAKMLIEAGACVDTVNKHNLWALELATLSEHQDMYELLLRHVAPK